jgi:hypothetical protein
MAEAQGQSCYVAGNAAAIAATRCNEGTDFDTSQPMVS